MTILSLPAGAAAASGSKNTTAWSNTGYVVLSASTPADYKLLGVQWQPSNLGAVDTTSEYLIEVATGGSGAESVKVQIPGSMRTSNLTHFYHWEPTTHWLPEPIVIPAGSRVTFRGHGSVAVAVTFGCRLLLDDVVAVAPDPPTDVVATQSAAGEIYVSWVAPVNDGGAAITDYDVEYAPDPYSSWTNFGAVDTDLEATIPGLTPHVDYKVRVAAINAAGAGSFAESNIVTIADVPDPPTGLVVLPQAGGRLAVFWDAPIDDGGATISDYLIEWGISPAFTASTNVLSPQTNYVITGLSAATYAVRVSAYNLAGASTTVATTQATQSFPFLEDFYEDNGSVWNTTAWPVGAMTAGGSLDVQSQKGRMTAASGAGSYINVGSYALPQDDIDFRFHWTITSNCRFRALFRAASDLAGYSLHLDTNADDVTLNRRTAAFVDSALTSGTQTSAYTMTVGDVIHVRIRSEGTSHKVKVWKNAESEPSTWLLDAVDAFYTGSSQRRVGFDLKNLAAGTITAELATISVAAPVPETTVVPSSFFFAA